MSLSKAPADSSKPLTADEQQLLMSLQRRAMTSQMNPPELDEDSEWGLASECAAMSDASKRRLTEF